MNPLGASILIVLIFMVLGVSRRVALLGMMAGVIYLTQAQQIDLGINCYAIRFLEVAGFIRVMSRGEFSFSQLNNVDRAFLWVYGFTLVVYLLRGGEGAAYQTGIAMDAFLSYFTFRGLIGEADDFRWFLRAFVILLAPFALLVLFESVSHYNLFTVLGGINGGDHWMRKGRPRCFGSFRQPVTLGMFAASFIPLYLGLACEKRERIRGLAGLGLCLLVAWASNSGGSMSGAAVGLFCWVFWRFRLKMRKVRWGIVAMIIALAMVMNSPIWFIFARASAFTGGDGWTRSFLIDQALNDLGRWWFAGMPILETKGWFPFSLEANGAADITNQFISFGLAAGVGAIVLFIILLKRAFSHLGRALAVVRGDPHSSKEDEFLLWGLGVMLVVHIIDWFGITYFDQMYMVWFMQLAAISSLAQAFLSRPAAAEVEEAVSDPDIPAPHPVA